MCKKSERKNSVTVSENAKSYEEEQILKYWTEERIRKARPLPCGHTHPSTHQKRRNPMKTTMKTTMVFILTLMLASTLFLTPASAQEYIHHATLDGHTRGVGSVSWSPDGATIASGSDDNTVRLWNATTGQHLKTLRGHTDDVFSVSWSPDGATIASGGRDNTVRLWEPTTGQHLS